MSPLAFSFRLLQAQPDAELVELARGGNKPAFEALVRRYRQPLLAYCRRMADANAEDALQQAFLQAWVALSDGLDVHDPRAWLYRIAHNVVVSNNRREGQTSAQLHEVIGARAVEEEAEERMVARDTLAGLAELPGLQRDALVGSAVDGLSHAQIARELGLTSGAVRGLIYRARATLRAAAAALIPSPVVHWAARQATSARAGSGGTYEVIAGGSAGVGGAIVKSGLVAATAGVLVTAATMARHPADHPAHHPHRIGHPVLHARGAGATRLAGAATGVALSAGAIPHRDVHAVRFVMAVSHRTAPAHAHPSAVRRQPPAAAPRSTNRPSNWSQPARGVEPRSSGSVAPARWRANGGGYPRDPGRYSAHVAQSPRSGWSGSGTDTHVYGHAWTANASPDRQAWQPTAVAPERSGTGYGGAGTTYGAPQQSGTGYGGAHTTYGAPQQSGTGYGGTRTSSFGGGFGGVRTR